MIVLKKEVSVAGQYDVVVCGGGPAGWIAAIAAARSNCRTALIERFGFLGGTATAGLVMPISGFYHCGKRVVGGIPWEFIQEMERHGAAQIEFPKGHISADPEYYKLIAQRMVIAAGVDLYTNSYLCDAVKRNRNISAVLIDNKNGTEALEGRFFIDATGDGDLCTLAGAEMRIQTNSQPLSMDFELINVDLTTPLLRDSIHHDGKTGHSVNEEIHNYLAEMNEKGLAPNFCGPWFNTLINGNRITVNITRNTASVLDNREFSKGEFQLREDIFTIVDLLRKKYPEFRNCTISHTAVNAGVRESRLLVGMYTLTGEDLFNGVDIPDSIAKNAHPVDIHIPEAGKQVLEEMPRSGHIPFRTMISPSLDNLLAAGRIISADARAYGTIRVQGTVMAIGEAAGTAAALCNKSGKTVHTLDIAQLQKILRENQCIF